MARFTLISNLSIVFLLIVVPCQAQAKSTLVQNLEAKKKQVIVAYGTSLTAKGGWIRQLQDELRKEYPGLATVINSGASGQWSKWGVENLDKRVIQKRPDAVFIEFSINDSVARFNCSVEQSKANLVAMIERIGDHNPQCEIILMTTTPGDMYPEGHRSYRKDVAAYSDMYRAVAKEHGLLLVDHHRNWIALQQKDKVLFRKYVPDSIHPSVTACSEVVTPAILEALGIQTRSKGAKKPGGGQAAALKGKLVNSKGQVLNDDLVRKKYFLYYYSNENGGRGDTFYTPRMATLEKTYGAGKNGKGVVIFCYFGKKTAGFKQWKAKHKLEGVFPKFALRDKRPFKFRITVFPYLLIRDAQGKVVQRGAAHDLWTQKKVNQYIR